MFCNDECTIKIKKAGKALWCSMCSVLCVLVKNVTYFKLGGVGSGRNIFLHLFFPRGAASLSSGSLEGETGTRVDAC